MSSKRKPNLIETDRGKEVYNNVFQSFLINKNNKHCSRNTYLGAVFAKRFNKSSRNLLKRPVFEKRDNNWIDIVPTITKQYNDRVHISTKSTPIKASLKKNEAFVYKNSLYKRKKVKPMFQLNDLVRVADLKRTLSEGDTTNWLNKL